MTRTRSVKANLLELPLFLLVFGVFSASMIVPSIYALVLGDHSGSRAFFYSGLLGTILFAMVAVAHAGRRP